MKETCNDCRFLKKAAWPNDKTAFICTRCWPEPGVKRTLAVTKNQFQSGIYVYRPAWCKEYLKGDNT